MKDFKSWDESFYTEDYDQEMLNFINSNYSVDYVNGWKVQTSLCQRGGEFFVSRRNGYDKMISRELTKEEFKRKIGMVIEEEKVADKDAFSKSDLIDGMFVMCRNGDVFLKLGNTLNSLTGYLDLEVYSNTLLDEDSEEDWDIVEVYQIEGKECTISRMLEEKHGLKSIWKRPLEKTQPQLKLEDLQQKMEALQEEMNILQKSIESGE
jgi:hypothetical protein